MFTYSVNVALNGKHLFRVEGIDSEPRLKRIVTDMVGLYGMEAVTVNKIPTQCSTRMDVAEIIKDDDYHSEQAIIEARKVVDCIDRPSGRLAITFGCGDIVLVSQRFNVLHVIKGDKQNWHQSAVHQWAIDKGYIQTKGL